MAYFAQRLEQLRTARKLTQTRLAQLLEVSPRVYSCWETGEATPQFATVVRIAGIIFNVSLDELAGRQDSSAGDARIHNPESHPLHQKVDHLSDADQKALLTVLDGRVKRFKVSRMMAEM